MSNRRYFNHIRSALIDQGGNLLFKSEEIETEAISYFSTLFNGSIHAAFPIFHPISTIDDQGQHFFERSIFI